MHIFNGEAAGIFRAQYKAFSAILDLFADFATKSKIPAAVLEKLQDEDKRIYHILDLNWRSIAFIKKTLQHNKMLFISVGILLLIQLYIPTTLLKDNFRKQWFSIIKWIPHKNWIRHDHRRRKAATMWFCINFEHELNKKWSPEEEDKLSLMFRSQCFPVSYFLFRPGLKILSSAFAIQQAPLYMRKPLSANANSKRRERRWWTRQKRGARKTVPSQAP